MGNVFLSDVGNVFLFVPVNLNQSLLKCHSLFANHVHPIMGTIYPYSYGYVQDDNTPCHKAKAVLKLYMFSVALGHQN